MKVCIVGAQVVRGLAPLVGPDTMVMPGRGRRRGDGQPVRRPLRGGSHWLHGRAQALMQARKIELTP